MLCCLRLKKNSLFWGWYFVSGFFFVLWKSFANYFFLIAVTTAQEAVILFD
jgi:hypothetical protein